jgi:hypothetical protein
MTVNLRSFQNPKVAEIEELKKQILNQKKNG